MDDVLSELPITTRPSWVALNGMAHSFIELDKAVIHVISFLSLLKSGSGFYSVCFLIVEDKRLV